MNKSPNFNFYLPSRYNEDVTDVNQISDNFVKIDQELFGVLKGKGVDQSYNPQSANPQSGKAVASALVNYLPLNAELQLELDGGDASAELDIEYIVDNAMSDISPNAVENRVVKQYIDSKTENINDFVVEQGVSGIWTYRKWNSGKVEFWGTQTFENVEVTKSSNNIGSFYSDAIAVPLPFDVFSNVIAIATNAGAGIWLSQYNQSDKNNVNVRANSPLSCTSTIYARIYAWSTWK